MNNWKTLKDLIDKDNMKNYYYQPSGSSVAHPFSAHSDEDALNRLKNLYGEHLVGISFVYESDPEDRTNSRRTIWME